MSVEFYKEWQEVLTQEKNLAETFRDQILVIYDKRLPSVIPQFSRFIEHFPLKYAVQAGEKLKDIEFFPQHMKKIVDLTQGISRGRLKILCVGGGSVGDFAGFVASILKRGVAFFQMPTTWLSAIDSAHGGKNALNVFHAKNQVGTFYFPDRILIVKDFLLRQPKELMIDASAEIVKVGLLNGEPWFLDLKKNLGALKKQPALLWDYVPAAVKSKYKIVNQDPHELKDIRALLNFGHTFGHVIEVYAKISHGKAVAQGLHFALDFSRKKGKLSDKDYKIAKSYLTELGLLPMNEIKNWKPIPKSQFTKLLLKDKKIHSSQMMKLVTLEKIGRARVDLISLQEILSFAKSENWVK